MKRLSELQDEKYHLTQTNTELRDWLEFYGLHDTTAAEDITGCVVWCHDGDVVECYFTESNRWFDLTAVYRPVSYYLEA